MTQNDKDLLLKDLCARLPYGIKVNEDTQGDFTLIGLTTERVFTTCEVEGCHNDFPIENIKPYLFPLSSITEEQKNELREMEWSFDNSTICNIIECFGTYRAYVDHSCCSELIDWFIKNHIDYRGLIPMGLANDATELNIY